MSQNSLSPDDPRLTAYALDEMPAAERVEFEKLLQSDPAARQAVDEIRSARTLLVTALEHEPAAPAQQAAIIPGHFGKLDGGKESPRQQVNKPIRFPQFYYIVSGLAAACFAMFFAYTEYNQRPLMKKEYVQVALPTAAAPASTVSDQAVDFQPEVREMESEADGNLAAAAKPADARELSLALAKNEAARKQAIEHQAYADAERRTKMRASKAQALNYLPPPPPAAAAHGWGVATGIPRQKDADTEAYAYRKDNGFLGARENPLSTFSIDVDTAAYANVRRFLNNGTRPPADAVRIEELVNYFPYRYQAPTGNVPFSANLEVASAPWAPEHRLVRIGLKGREVSDAARPAANLVFLLDVSGSMQSRNKLPLVKQSLRLLVDKLRPDDRVAITVYAGASGMALPSTPVSRKADILEAIDRLEANGSTNGAMGIQLAYDIAKANFVGGGVNRVILATDGDFNVGTTSEGELVRLIEEKAKSGVFLSVLGFGMGNLKDSTLEQLADKGNGNYAYIDSLAEAKKSLVEQAGGTLVTIAKDVKIQVEFNPAQVQAYRLIGYENRLLAKEDFNNDKVDAGEIGAGHTVTALYEVVPAGAEMPATSSVDPLKYQAVSGQPSALSEGKADSRKLNAESSISGELLTVKVRYKEPAAEESKLLDFPLRDRGVEFEQASEDFKFAASVAAFGMILRDSPYKGTATFGDVTSWARAGIGSDAGGYRSEFLGLAEKARTMIQ